eukprot:gene34854-20749_t
MASPVPQNPSLWSGGVHPQHMQRELFSGVAVHAAGE